MSDHHPKPQQSQTSERLDMPSTGGPKPSLVHPSIDDWHADHPKSPAAIAAATAASKEASDGERGPVILQIMNGDKPKQATTTKPLGPPKPAYTAPFPHPTDPSKVILRNPWDREEVTLDKAADEKAAAAFYALHVPPRGPSRTLLAEPGMAIDAVSPRLSSSVELLPSSSAPDDAQVKGFAMGALLPPLVDFLPDEVAVSPVVPKKTTQQQQTQRKQEPPTWISKQPQLTTASAPTASPLHTSFEEEMLAIFNTVRMSTIPQATASSLPQNSGSMMDSTELSSLVSSAPPLRNPAGGLGISRPYTPPIPPPKRAAPPRPPPPAQSLSNTSSNASGGTGSGGGSTHILANIGPPSDPPPQVVAVQSQSASKARSSLDAIQLAALSLVATLDADELKAHPPPPPAAAAAAVPRQVAMVVPTVMSAKRVQVTAAKPGAYTTTTSSGSLPDMPRMLSSKSSEALLKEGERTQAAATDAERERQKTAAG